MCRFASIFSVFFFFNDTATTEIYTLSLHDALPILVWFARLKGYPLKRRVYGPELDRKSTRLNSSHANISYAVFCLKKKKHTHKRVSTDQCRPRLLTLENPCTPP